MKNLELTSSIIENIDILEELTKECRKAEIKKHKEVVAGSSNFDFQKARFIALKNTVFYFLHELRGKNELANQEHHFIYLSHFLDELEKPEEA